MDSHPTETVYLLPPLSGNITHTYTTQITNCFFSLRPQLELHAFIPQEDNRSLWYMLSYHNSRCFAFTMLSSFCDFTLACVFITCLSLYPLRQGPGIQKATSKKALID